MVSRGSRPLFLLRKCFSTQGAVFVPCLQLKTRCNSPSLWILSVRVSNAFSVCWVKFLDDSHSSLPWGIQGSSCERHDGHCNGSGSKLDGLGGAIWLCAQRSSCVLRESQVYHTLLHTRELELFVLHCWFRGGLFFLARRETLLPLSWFGDGSLEDWDLKLRLLCLYLLDNAANLHC